MDLAFCRNASWKAESSMSPISWGTPNLSPSICWYFFWNPSFQRSANCVKDWRWGWRIMMGVMLTPTFIARNAASIMSSVFPLWVGAIASMWAPRLATIGFSAHG